MTADEAAKIPPWAWALGSGAALALLYLAGKMLVWLIAEKFKRIENVIEVVKDLVVRVRELGEANRYTRNKLAAIERHLGGVPPLPDDEPSILRAEVTREHTLTPPPEPITPGPRRR